MRTRWQALALLGGMVLQSAVARAAPLVVVYSQQLPGARNVSGLAVDNSGAAYVLGGAYYGGGTYVSKVDSSGELWTVRIGGSPSEKFHAYLESASAVATDVSGNVYVVGSTSSPDFPTVNAIQDHLGGGWDGFLTKLSPEGNMPRVSF